VKIYQKEKGKDQTETLEDHAINTFEKFDLFIEKKINSINIDQQFTCIYFNFYIYFIFI